MAMTEHSGWCIEYGTEIVRVSCSNEPLYDASLFLFAVFAVLYLVLFYYILLHVITDPDV